MVALLLNVVSKGVMGLSGGPEGAHSGAVLDDGLRLISEGRHEDCRRLVEPLAAGRPDLSKAQFVLGLTYHGEDRPHKAREHFARAIQLDPHQDLYRLYYGMCLYKLGELGASRAVLGDYLARNPRDSNALVAIGLIDFDQDRAESAREHLAKAVALAPTSIKQGRARKHLADVLVRLGELQAAREELRQSIELNPTDDRAYHRLANVLQRLGDGQGAAQARERMRIVQEAAMAAPSAEEQSGKEPDATGEILSDPVDDLRPGSVTMPTSGDGSLPP
jgi:predicted Zn-dependent protease